MNLKLKCLPEMNENNDPGCFSMQKYFFLDLRNNFWEKNTQFWMKQHHFLIEIVNSPYCYNSLWKYKTCQIFNSSLKVADYMKLNIQWRHPSADLSVNNLWFHLRLRIGSSATCPAPCRPTPATETWRPSSLAWRKVTDSRDRNSSVDRYVPAWRQEPVKSELTIERQVPVRRQVPSRNRQVPV